MEKNIQTALATVREAGQLPVAWNTIDECTAEILQWKNTIGLGVYRIGQALLWAKAKLPHGEFGDWLRDTVDFSPTTAQNFMRIAREVDEGSSIARLPYTKILALLELPRGEREAFAEEIGAEDRSAAEIRRLIREKEELEKNYEQQTMAMRSELAEAEKRAYRANAANQLQVEKLREQREKLEQERDSLVRVREKEIERLKREVAKLQQQEPTVIRDEPEDYQELKVAVERLAEEKARVEAEADRLADELDRAKLGKAREETSPATRILSAIGGLMVMVGRDPAMLHADPGMMDDDDWALVMDKVTVVGSWVSAMQQAWARREEAAI